MFGFPLVFLVLIVFAMVFLVCGGAPSFDIVFVVLPLLFCFLVCFGESPCVFFGFVEGAHWFDMLFVPEYSYGCSDCPNLST